MIVLVLHRVISRWMSSLVIEALEAEESLAHLASFGGAVLASDAILESGGGC